MRPLSLTLREAMHAQESGLVPIFLLTITHPDLPDPIRLSSDPTTLISDTPLKYGTVSNGQTYTFVRFTYLMADEKDDTPPAQKLRLDNIDRNEMPAIVALLRSTTVPATVKIDMVQSDALDFVEISGVAFDLTSTRYDANSVDLDLTIESLAFEPYPYGTFNPAQFAGLF